MILKFYHLYCTNCHREYKNDIFESKRDAIKYSKEDGWRRIKVQNGSYWDFCPDCFREHKKEV